MFLVLLITNRCNAHCAHCAVSSSPKDKSFLSLEEACSYIHEAAQISKDNQDFWVGFSGGEPFFCYNDLIEMIQYANGEGAKVSCVTNGFWGTSYQQARNRIKALKEAGLRRLVLTYDRFHSQFVPLDNIKTIFAACRDVGIPFGLKCVVLRDSQRITDILRELKEITIDVEFSIQEIHCLPVGRAKKFPTESFLYQKDLPTKRCNGQGVINISSSGEVYPCCTPGWPKLLSLGNARKTPLSKMIDQAQSNSLLQALRHKGPAYFIPFLEETGCSFPPGSFVNECHLCQTVLTVAENNGKIHAALEDALKVWKDESEREKSAIETILSFFG